MARFGGQGFGPQGLSQPERDALKAEIDDVDGRTALAKEKGDFQMLLELMENSLFLRRRLYGEGSEQVYLACRQLCEVCNYCATTMLQQGNARAALDLLRRAEKVSEKSDLDRAITFNNMACYYRRTGKLRTALSFLERALAIEEHTQEADVAQTHLNLCATLSQLQRHDRALYHAQCALVRIFEILAPAMLNGELSPPQQEGQSLDGKLFGVDPVLSERISVLCIAYHNLAVEHEYLKSFRAAMTNYREGLKWAGRFLGEEHQIFAILKHSMLSVSKILDQSVGKRVPHGGAGTRPGPARPMGGLPMPQQVLAPQVEQLLSSTPRDPPPPPQAAGEDGSQQRMSGAEIQKELYQEIVGGKGAARPPQPQHRMSGVDIQHELYEEIVVGEKGQAQPSQSPPSPTVDAYEDEVFEEP